MNDLRKTPATRREIDERSAGQRVDNYLAKTLKGVPKSRLYRMLRSGEVRVNSRRIDADYRLQLGDQVRIPPVSLPARVDPARKAVKPRPGLERAIIFEDRELLALNKPAGIAVHGGSGISFGVIEAMRAGRPEIRFLELVHRLDRDTSGVLLLAKKRSALTALHSQLRAGQIEKRYLALVKGRWTNRRQQVQLNLHKYVLTSGERRVSVAASGQASRTLFELESSWTDFTLLKATLITGRTHQIRVHLAHLGFPIAGDDKYGDFALNKNLAAAGFKRMFLHAASVGFAHPASGEPVTIQAPLSAELAAFLKTLQPL
jgi:23S rRNA pseudouridine955/2504/2580 synthase